MATPLFGTDGIRDRALHGNLAPDRVERLGRVISSVIRLEGPVLIGRDTRESGPEIEAALVRGLAEAEVVLAGVIPTPGVAYLTRKWRCALGIVISASHNPADDNGIKLISPEGRKVPDAAERRIEELFDSAVLPPRGPARAVDAGERATEYVDGLRRAAGRPLDGTKLVVDCANGAASPWARRVFEPLGAKVIAIHDAPDGRNINAGCGAVHMESVAQAVVRERADLGVAFDGDADRAMFVDARGVVRDGDDVLWLAARSAGPVMVSTVMANLGLERALEAKGVRLVRAAVGDRYVAEAMDREGARVGGEPSGHVIFRDYAPTGDGMLTALMVLRMLRERKTTLAMAVEGWTRYPQVLKNVRVREKPAIDGVPAVAAAIRDAEQTLGRQGRILVRYSGTEPLCRVMVEGADATQVESAADSIAGAVQQALGVV